MQSRIIQVAFAVHVGLLTLLFVGAGPVPALADDGCLGAAIVETAVLPLVLDLDTSGQPDRAASLCAIELGAADVVVAVEIDTSLALEISATPAQDFDVLLYLRAQECDDPAAELVCSDAAGAGGVEWFQLVLAPGTYYIYADGCTPADFGPVTIEVAGVLPVPGSTWGEIKAGYRHSMTPDL